MTDRTQEKVFHKIISPVTGFVENAQNTLPGDSDRYTLCLTAFIYNIMFAIICNIRSISLLITEIRTSSAAEEFGLPDASNSMYSEAFSRYSPDIFRMIFYELLASVSFLNIPEISHLGRILLADGSLFPALVTMQWACYKQDANAIKLHLAFELNRMIPTEFIATDGKYSERKFLRSIVEKGVTYVCDRGYVSFSLFSEICEKGAHFIIRGKENMTYTVHEVLCTDVPTLFLKFFITINDYRVIFSSDPKKVIYRIVRFSVSGESYTLITNRSDLTTYEVIMLYAYRWQIELFFRFLKRTLNGIHLMTHSPKGVQAQFYIYMISYLLLLIFRQQCQKAIGNDNESDGILSQEHKNEILSEKTRARASERPYVCGLVSFLGENLKNFWKIGLHWLTAVKNFLISDFDIQLIRKLSAFQ